MEKSKADTHFSELSIVDRLVKDMKKHKPSMVSYLWIQMESPLPLAVPSTGGAAPLFQRPLVDWNNHSIAGSYMDPELSSRHLGKLRQEDDQWEVRLSNIVRPRFITIIWCPAQKRLSSESRNGDQIREAIPESGRRNHKLCFLSPEHQLVLAHRKWSTRKASTIICLLGKVS